MKILSNKCLLGLSVLLLLGICSVYGGCTFNYRNTNDFVNHWPTMPIQETPGDEGFCARDGAVYLRFGTLVSVLGIKSFYTNHWTTNPQNSVTGYFGTRVFLELNVGGFGFATFDYNVSNHINGITPCRISPNGATEPNQETMVISPNLEMDLIRVVPNGKIRVQDNFIYGDVSTTTGLVDKFTNLRNNDFQTPNVIPSLIEIEYERESDLTNCPVYNAYFGNSRTEELPKLEDDLERIWELENGVSLSGAEIRKILADY